MNLPEEDKPAIQYDEFPRGRNFDDGSAGRLTSRTARSRRRRQIDRVRTQPRSRTRTALLPRLTASVLRRDVLDRLASRPSGADHHAHLLRRGHARCTAAPRSGSRKRCASLHGQGPRGHAADRGGRLQRTRRRDGTDARWSPTTSRRSVAQDDAHHQETLDRGARACRRGDLHGPSATRRVSLLTVSRLKCIEAGGAARPCCSSEDGHDRAGVPRASSTRPRENIATMSSRITDFTRRYLIETYGVPARPRQPHLPGHRPRDLHAETRSAGRQARQRYPSTRDGAFPVLGNVGSFEPRKGQVALLEALALVRGHRPERAPDVRG